jgi:hypothetical protein
MKKRKRPVPLQDIDLQLDAEIKEAVREAFLDPDGLFLGLRIRGPRIERICQLLRQREERIASN